MASTPGLKDGECERGWHDAAQAHMGEAAMRLKLDGRTRLRTTTSEAVATQARGVEAAKRSRANAWPS